MVRVTACRGGYELWIVSDLTRRKISLIDKDPSKSEILNIPAKSDGFAVFLPASEMTTSYGMNSNATEILDYPGKVLVMDFVYSVALPGEIWSDHYPNNSHVPVFARHSNRMNVLFTSGSVKLMEPDAVDPHNADVKSTYWLP